MPKKRLKPNVCSPVRPYPRPAMVGSRPGLRRGAGSGQRAAGGPAPTEPDQMTAAIGGGASPVSLSFFHSLFFRKAKSRPPAVLCESQPVPASPSRTHWKARSTDHLDSSHHVQRHQAQPDRHVLAAGLRSVKSRYHRRHAIGRGAVFCACCVADADDAADADMAVSLTSPRVKSILNLEHCKPRRDRKENLFPYGTVFLFSIGAIPTPAYSTHTQRAPLRLASTSSQSTENKTQKPHRLLPSA